MLSTSPGREVTDQRSGQYPKDAISLSDSCLRQLRDQSPRPFFSQVITTAEADDHPTAAEPCRAEAASAAPAAVTLEHHNLAGGKRAAAGQLDTCVSLVQAAGDSENHLTAKRQIVAVFKDRINTERDKAEFKALCDKWTGVVEYPLGSGIKASPVQMLTCFVALELFLLIAPAGMCRYKFDGVGVCNEIDCSDQTCYGAHAL
eukprot:gene9574-9736_t